MKKKDRQDQDDAKGAVLANAGKVVAKEGKVLAKKEFRFKTVFRNVILDVLRARGYKEYDDDNEWDFFWAVCQLEPRCSTSP